MFWKIDKAGITVCNLYRDGDEFLQHIVDSEARADNSACTVEDGHLPCARTIP